jgi:type I restriction enzyme S subunit
MSSIVPDGWRINTIDEIAKTSAGGTPSTQKPEYWEDGDIPWMSSGEVHKKRVRNVDKFITQQGYKNSSAKLFPPKTLLMALAGQGKTRGTVAISEMELTTNQSIAAIMITDDLVHPDYVFQNLDGRYNELRSVSGGSGRAGLNLTIIGEQVVLLPPLPEQIKIAQILTSVDDVIEKTQAQIDKLKDLKTAMMQELLTKGIGHFEFKDSQVGRIPVGWDIREFARVVKDSNQGVNTTTEKVTYSESGITAIRSNNVEENRLDMRDKKFVSREMYNRLTDKVKPRLNDVLYCNIGSKLGAAAVVTTDDEMLITWNVLRISVKATSLMPKYFSYLLNSNRKGLRGVATESTMPFISSKVLSKYEFIIPPLSEQKRIVAILESLDGKSLLADEKLSALKNMKKALMQDLLTGKVRVNTELSNSSLAVG